MISVVILISHMDAESIHFTYFPLIPTNHPEPVSLLLSEAVSKEQGLIPETHTHRGRENRMDKSCSLGVL